MTSFSSSAQRGVLVALALLGAGGAQAQADTFTVTNNSDATSTDGDVCNTSGTGDGCSLHEAITAANGDGVDSEITFSATAFASPRKTITLDSELILANDGKLSITGPTAGVVIDGVNNSKRLFIVNADASADFDGLTIINGSAGIFNSGTTNIQNCTLRDNSYNTYNTGGTTTLTNCTSNNTSTNFDNGIYNSGGITNLFNCTLKNVNGYSLVNISRRNTVNLTNCTVSGNGNNGIFNNGTANVNNTIVVGNGLGFSDPSRVGTLAGSYNITSGTAAQAGLETSDGVDATVWKNNGGPTDTIKLVTGGLAVNAGDPAFDGAGKFDQRGAGFARVVGGRLDIGAYESAFVPPVLSSVAIETTEDTTFTFAATSFDGGFNDTNAGDTLQSVRIDSLPANGVLNFNGVAVTLNQTIARADLPKLSFTPTSNFNGSTGFDFNASDGTFFAAKSARLTLTVTAVNDAPSFTLGASQTVAENSGAQSVANFATNIKAGPANEASQALTFVVTNDNNALFSVQPAIAANGTLTYTLAPNAAGTATISAKVHDSGGAANGGVDTSATQTFAITVTPNPINFGVSLSPAGPFTNDKVTATPIIVNGSGVTYAYEFFVNGASVQKGAGNTLDLSKAGFGDKGDAISVTVSASNTRGGRGSATNQITVRNSAPFAFSGSASAQSGVATSIAFRPFNNPGGADADGEAITFKSVGGPTNGSGGFVTGADGSIALNYTSRVGFSGVETIRFVAVDEAGRTSNVATLGINVTGGLPLAQNASASATSGVRVDVPVVGTSGDGGAVTFKRVGGPTNGVGEFVKLANGSTVLRYTSRANFVGTEEVRFVALNAAGRPSSVAMIRINVSAGKPSALQAGDAPSAGNS